MGARGPSRPQQNDPRGRGADATPSSTLYLDATLDAIAATGRDAIDATQDKNRQPYPAPG